MRVPVMAASVTALEAAVVALVVDLVMSIS
jgi:hypothetical protein